MNDRKKKMNRGKDKQILKTFSYPSCVIKFLLIKAIRRRETSAMLFKSPNTLVSTAALPGNVSSNFKNSWRPFSARNTSQVAGDSSIQ